MPVVRQTGTIFRSRSLPTWLLVSTLIVFVCRTDVLGQVDRIGRPVDVANASWVRQALATDLMYPIGLHVSGEGDVFVTGFLLDQADFGGAIIESERSWGFIARYGPDGELRWARPGSVPTGLPWLSVHAVATHGDRIYASEGEVPGSTHRDWYDAGGILVTEFSPMGDSLRSLVVGGRNAAGHWMSYIHGLGTDRAGNLYIGGAYGDTLTLHPDVVLAPMDTNKYNADLFLASYTPEWELRWGRRMGGKTTDQLGYSVWLARSFVVDRDGNTYLGGSFGADAVFGEGQPNQVALTERRSHGVASYDAAGALRWVRTTRDFGIESDGTVGIQHLMLDDHGNFFVSWIVFGNATWIAAGDTTFSDLEYYYLLITKHAPDGDLQWARLVESNRSLKVEYSATDHRGHVYVAGYSDGTFIDLEGAILRNAHGGIHEHAFVAHYDETGSLVRLVHVAGDGNKYINAVATSRGGDVYIAVDTGRNSPETVIGTDTIRVDAENVMLVAKFGAVDTGSGSIAELPERVVITGSYPNSFRETATIYYELPAASWVRVSVYDLLGRELAVLVDRFEQAGRKEVVLDGSRWPGGVYLYRLEAGDQVATGRLVRRK